MRVMTFDLISIPEVNFCVRAFKFGTYVELNVIFNISSFFLYIHEFVILAIFLTRFLNRVPVHALNSTTVQARIFMFRPKDAEHLG